MHGQALSRIRVSPGVVTGILLYVPLMIVEFNVIFAGEAGTLWFGRNGRLHWIFVPCVVCDLSQIRAQDERTLRSFDLVK